MDRRAGMVGCLAKPIDVGQLRQVIERIAARLQAAGTGPGSDGTEPSADG